MDNCLLLIEVDRREAHNILEMISKTYDRISATIQIEKINKLKYLELTIKKKNEKWQFYIFRKSPQASHVNQVIAMSKSYQLLVVM